MIPYLLIAVGGVMILAGVKKQNPLVVLKAVLTNSPIPGDTGGTGTTATPTPTAPDTSHQPNPTTGVVPGRFSPGGGNGVGGI